MAGKYLFYRKRKCLATTSEVALDQVEGTAVGTCDQHPPEPALESVPTPDHTYASSYSNLAKENQVVILTLLIQKGISWCKIVNVRYLFF